MAKRIAERDAFWKVDIRRVGSASGFYWAAITDDNTGAEYGQKGMDGFVKHANGARRNWEAYAKLNGITKWEYV
jgi:hypothetical protein